MYSAISRSSSETSLELYDFGPLSALHHRSLSPPLWLLNASHHELKIRRRRRRLFWLQASPVLVTIVLIILTAIFNPSYTSKPPTYTGKNTLDEKVFIAAAIVDADLIRGAWGNAVLELIAVIGAENVFLSVYNNDSGPDTKAALEDLAQLVSCEKAIVSEHLPLDSLAQPELAGLQENVRRISYLAEVRNRALRPFYQSSRTFDKILFLNDVVFNAPDAVDLLFATGTTSLTSRTSYHAACAVDFINPFKFYDTFATRDTDGYGIGVPFFPWFASRDGGQSRQSVLAGSDSVPVQSCWGGMVAFEARWFMHQSGEQPVRFRGEEEMFWESSECCLIHADIAAQARRLNISSNEDMKSGGIVMNPFIRVAYSTATFRWLALTRRFERLYSVPHLWISWFAGHPSIGERQFDQEGDTVQNMVWSIANSTSSTWDDTRSSESTKSPFNGCYEKVQRTAAPGGFCGSRKLLVLKSEHQPGERMWENLPAPALHDLCT